MIIQFLNEKAIFGLLYPDEDPNFIEKIYNYLNATKSLITKCKNKYLFLTVIGPEIISQDLASSSAILSKYIAEGLFVDFDEKGPEMKELPESLIKKSLVKEELSPFSIKHSSKFRNIKTYLYGF